VAEALKASRGSPKRAARSQLSSGVLQLGQCSDPRHGGGSGRKRFYEGLASATPVQIKRIIGSEAGQGTSGDLGFCKGKAYRGMGGGRTGRGEQEEPT